jgi:hypothetical protein
MLSSIRFGSFASLLSMAVGVALTSTGSANAGQQPKPQPNVKPATVVKPTIVRPTIVRPTITRPTIGTQVNPNVVAVPIPVPVPVMPFPAYNPYSFFRPMFPQMNPLAMYALYSMMNNPIDGLMYGSMGGSFASPGTAGLPVGGLGVPGVGR